MYVTRLGTTLQTVCRNHLDPVPERGQRCICVISVDRNLNTRASGLPRGTQALPQATHGELQCANAKLTAQSPSVKGLRELWR